MFKPFIRTIILAGILFFLLVYLGMQYHWGETLKKSTSKPPQKQLELSIPKAEDLVEEPQDLTVPIIDVEPLEAEDALSEEENQNDELFEPEIIKNGPTIALIDSMTKDQIAIQCQQLYNQSFNMADDPSVDLLIGNCVVSNFQEPFEESIKTPQIIQKEQQIKQRAISNCRYQILQPDNNGLSGIEKQLLIGICVSNQINQK